MVGGAGEYAYEWSINGVVYATSESITVPASAAYGDRIGVTVTDEEGNTATDLVFVGGFTIVEVEPTTANDGGDYKYIRATFSTALSSLDPSEIEIRRKSDKQLYSVEEVRLSSDGKTADITLFGNKLEAGTEFLKAATIYVMTVTHDGFTDELEFQLPDNQRDLIVTSVDVENGIIVTVGDGRTSLPDGGQFTVGDAYLGNLGYLVGRNVVIGANADRELMNFSIEDQSVVIAKVKYVEKDAADADKNYFETPDETKYYLTDDATTTVAATTLIDAADDTNAIALVDKDEYQYAKLVLNKNGRVATAVLQGKTAWDGHIIVTETDDTTVVESADFALDFDGYTIVKNDEYVEVEDLEAGDICYYNTGAKFVDVYTESVTGNIEKINSEKITIDGTAYNWAGAQYLKSSKYATLAGTADTVEDDLAYLYSLDEDEDTTIVLNRKGDIQVIDGTVKDEVKTTSSIYVLTEAGATYKIGTKGYLELKGSNGTQETLVIDLSAIKKYNNAEATLAYGSADNKFTIDGGADQDAPTIFAAKTPVKITENEDGEIIEIDLRETTGKAGKQLVDGDQQTIDSDSTQMIGDAANTKVTLKSSTPVYIVNDKKDDDGVSPFKVEKTTLGEMTKTAKADYVTAYVKSSSTAAEYIIVDNTTAAAWTTTDTETIGGVIKSITKGLNTSSGKEEVESITLLTASGEVELDADELGYTGTTYAVNNYAGFVVKKGTYTLAQEALSGDVFEAAVTLDAGRAYSDTKFVDQDATVTVSKAATAKVFVYDGTAKTYTETTIGAVNTKKEEAQLKYHIVDENGTGVVTSDIMVITWTGLANPAAVTLVASALEDALVVGDVIGTTSESSDTNLANVTYKLQTKGGTDVATLGYTDATKTQLKVTAIEAGEKLEAATEYRIEATPAMTDPAPETQFATVYSNIVKTAAQAATLISSTSNDSTAALTTGEAADTFTFSTGDPDIVDAAWFVLDQFGNDMTTADDDGLLSVAAYGADGSQTTLKIGWDGSANVMITLGDITKLATTTATDATITANFTLNAVKYTATVTTAYTDGTGNPVITLTPGAAA